MFKLLLFPLIYACIVGTVFHRWADAHPFIANGIFIVLVAIPVIRCLVFLVRIIREAVSGFRYWVRLKRMGF